MLNELQWEPESIPELGAQLPPGIYAVVCGEPEERFTDDGRLVLDIQHVIEAPAEYKGLRLRDSFWLGTEGDPKFRDPESQKKIGGQRLKNLCLAAGASMSRSVAACVAGIPGKVVLANVVQKPAKNDPEKLYSNISKYFKQGEREVGEAAKGATEPKRAATPNGAAGVAGMARSAGTPPPPPPPLTDLVEE